MKKPHKRAPPRSAPRTIAGAKPAPYPGYISPCLATLRDRPPKGDRWLHEIKWDGYRAQIHRHAGKILVYSRGGHDWAKQFFSIAEAAREVRADDVIIDGEVIVQDEQGRSSFGALQADLAAHRTSRMLFHAFDLLYLDGFDLRPVPLEERKRALRDLLGSQPVGGRIVYSEHVEMDGEAMFRRACELGLEGIVSKLRTDRYRSGRTDSWIKTKCWQRGTFAVIGFVPQGRASIAALRLARVEAGALVYCGKVGTGWDRATAADIRTKLDAIVRGKPALERALRKPGTTWVDPLYQVDVDYAEISDDGMLRHPAFRSISRRKPT